MAKRPHDDERASDESTADVQAGAEVAHQENMREQRVTGQTARSGEARHPEIEHPSQGYPDPLPVGYRQEDAWPPRSGAQVDPRMTQETARSERMHRDATSKRADQSKETMSAFIAKFVEDAPPEVVADNRFTVHPDKPVDAGDVADGWYVDKGWAFEVKDGKLLQALGPGAPNRPTQFVAV